VFIAAFTLLFAVARALKVLAPDPGTAERPITAPA
jgi:hypothetical protein